MKHRMYHSNNLRQALPEYAQRLGCSVEELESAYDWMLQNDVCFERQIKDDMLCSISYVNIEPRIEHPLARRFYAMLGKERLYDPGTGEVYEFQNGFYDQYRLNPEQYRNSQLQPLPDGDAALWGAPTLDGSRALGN